jgi:hypothetical protein
VIAGVAARPLVAHQAVIIGAQAAAAAADHQAALAAVTSITTLTTTYRFDPRQGLNNKIILSRDHD